MEGYKLTEEQMERCRAKYFHVQRRMFRDDSRDLTQGEYQRLLETARRSGEKRLELAMETIGATGIRVSELAYITVEAASKNPYFISF